MNNINTSFKKIHSLLILTFLCFLILINKTYSEEKIGSVVALKGEIIAINTDDEKRTLEIYDDIFLFDEIVTNNSSSVTIQYDDNSTVIIKSSSSLTITEFVFSIAKKKFLGIVKKGKVIIESGKIAKTQEGSMEIQLPTMILGIRGTRFNMKINPNGTSEVGLSEDSFGNVGTINISSDGKVQTLYDTDQVISANIDTGISERPKTDDEKKELVDASNDLIEASSIDENLIQEKLEEKLANGTLLDANNDGIIDLSDIDIIKENIKIEKQENINFIVENSTGENTEFLSNVLNISDEASIGQSMNQILETNDYLVASVITNLADEDNTFLTTSNLEANNVIKEKIFTQMLNDTDDENNNIAVIGSIFAKSDAESVGLMMDTIQTVGETNADSTLALEVFSSMADSGESFDDMDFGYEEHFGDEEYFDDEMQEQFDQMMEIQEQYDQMMEQAVFSAADSEDGAMMLANIMTEADADTMGIMMDTIGMMGETNADSTLALEVLSSMADSESFDDMNFGDEGQEQYDQMMEQAVFSAADSEDGAMMLANIMTEADADTMGTMMDTIGMMGETNPDSTLALEVLSSMADSESFDDMDFGNEGQDQFDKMMEQAVFSAADSEDGAMMLANVITEVDADTMGTMLDYISDVSENDENSTFAAEVLSSVATAAAASNTYFDTEKMDHIYDFIDTTASITTSATEEYDTVATTGATTTAEDEAALPTWQQEGFMSYDDWLAAQTTSTTDEDTTGLYDADGFSWVPPYYHKDTGTAYNMAGFDKYGDIQGGASSATETYDADGFSIVTPFYHKDTGTAYNPSGFDKDGNTSAGAGSNPTWSMEPTFDSSYTTDDSISVYATAYSSPVANGIDYSATDLPTGVDIDSSGYISGTPSTPGIYYVVVTATDSMDFMKSISTASFTVTVTAAGGGGSNPTWDTEPTFTASYTTDDSISTTAAASSSPVANGINYSASDLPTGVEINTTTGAITGSPSTPGIYYVVVTATDKLDIMRSISTASFTVTVTAAGGGGSNPTWDTEPTFTASYTTDDSISITAAASSSPVANGINYSASDLPTGVEINTITGAITGSPSTPGIYYVVVTATDKLDIMRSISTASFTVTVTAAGGGGSNPTWDTEPTFTASYTTDDSISTTAAASSSPVANGINYSASDLPTGVEINTITGAITGSPSTPGIYYVVVTATDKLDIMKSISTASFTVTVTAGIYDARGFSIVTPFYHRVTGTLYDNDGYNSAGYNNQGYNAAMVYNALYDEKISP